jgi:hypothetical protein
LLNKPVLIAIESLAFTGMLGLLITISGFGSVG